ncbi:glycosyltransferase [Christensenellaceae bacterium OttesenSCG-928-K19]|nr:glycosyltransferase [Christensenellaceae bacterium OttesenSCG-928-K19]
MNNQFSHCFAICAYKESPHIEECIKSLKAQSIPARVILCTSTPNEYLNALAKKHDIPLFVRQGESGLAPDWNFALQTADADFVTIAHQDDIYEEHYLERMQDYARQSGDPIILFTDYGELRGEDKVHSNKLLDTKRKINAALKRRAFWGSRFIRKRSLALGCAICCPSVCLHKKKLPEFRFDSSFSCDLDWDAWSRLAKETGDFVYIPEILMHHRIHTQSETTRLLTNGVRFKEDLIILERYWPKPLARLILGKYKESAKSNEGGL